MMARSGQSKPLKSSSGDLGRSTRIFPSRRRGGRRHRRVRIHDTALMELFDTDDEEEFRRELARRGVTPYESAGRMFVSDYELKENPPLAGLQSSGGGLGDALAPQDESDQASA